MSEHTLSRPTATQFDVSPLRRFSWNFTDTLVILRRNLLYYVRLPELVFFSSVQPIIFVLMFTYVFGGAIQTPGGNYINYLLPGILVQTVLFGGANTSIGLATDLSKGFVDRFRSLPMARSAFLAGRTLADTVRNLFVIILMVTVGYIIGFRFEGDVFHILGAVVLLLAFGHVASWLFASIGIIVKDPETAQVGTFVWLFPLMFMSSIFVPVQTMPDWLRTFAENQPVSLVANTARAWMLGMPTDDAWRAIAWLVALFVISMPIAIRLYRRSAG